MAISNNQVTVTTSPTAIFGPDIDGAYLVLKVSGSKTVYLGNATVTADNGLEVENEDGPFPMTLGPNEILYGIVEEDTGKITVLATLNSG